MLLTLETVKRILLLSMAVNFILLLIWFLVFRFAHGMLYRFHGGIFRIAPDKFDELHYTAMAFYKILILVFNFAPLAAILLLK